ncbi:MAG: HlyD family type I secretion periplasmic adaptor subunit [Methylomicrobium sp.]
MLNEAQQGHSLVKSEGLKTDDLPIRTIGFAIILITFGIFGVWGYFAPIDSSALAPGVVTVKSYKKTVQHLDGGIVAKILARDGALVEEGQDLIILDDTQTKAQLEIVKGQYITLLALVARLQSERDNASNVIYPDKLADHSDPRVIEAKQTESHVFEARKNTYEGEISVLRKRVNQIASKIKGLEGQVSSKKQLIASYSEEIKDLRELLAEGFADRQRLRDLERNHALVSGEIAELISTIASSQMQIGETELQILQIQKQFQEEVARQLSEAMAQLYDISERLTATQDKLNRTVIKAPASGMVLGMSVHTEGGVITPGKPILDIVPQNSDLIIEAQVSPLDIDRVSVGLTAEVRFSAFKQALTPVMHGEVIQLSADRFIDERTGAPYYLARVELTPESFEKLGDLQLLPGMPAEVLINTGERTLFEYLAQPITNAFARAFIED